MRSSGRNNPCPVCGRTKDTDCRWNDAKILCHTGTDLRPGDTLTIARQKWAFIHHKGGFSGMAAVFKPHRERNREKWKCDPRVFVDHGREMPNGQPALLKRREYLRRDAAEQRWKELLQLGWSAIDPAWGADAEP